MLARNTGALHLAQAARALETQIAAEEPDLEPLRDAVSETLAYLGDAAPDPRPRAAICTHPPGRAP